MDQLRGSDCLAVIFSSPEPTQFPLMGMHKIQLHCERTRLQSPDELISKDGKKEANLFMPP